MSEPLNERYQNYLSPFSWRYGSPAMRRVWSETHKRLVWRRLWVALAEVQAGFGLVSGEQVRDLRAHQEDINIPRALEIEAEIHHDLMAEVRAYAEQCLVGGGIIHLGMTSMDIVDNADILRTRDALDLVLEQLTSLLVVFVEQIRQYAELPVMAFTHLQPAEPTTLGYRLAQYAQDLFTDYENLFRLRSVLRGKGLKGAVGTSASYQALVGPENLAQFESSLAEKLDLAFYPVTTQTYPRKQDYDLLCALAGLGASLYKFAFDLRLLQSPPFGELAEPFGAKQVGSSAMPFKRNPIQAEKIDSLGRLLAQYPRVAWDNAAHSLLERTLDDSANRRTILPEAFLLADEMVKTAFNILRGLRVDLAGIQHNMDVYGPFAATERVLMAAVQAGADRQVIHERLRELALQAWAAIQNRLPDPESPGVSASNLVQANPLTELVARDDLLRQFIDESLLRTLMHAGEHVGDAAARSLRLAEMIEAALALNS